LGLAFFGLTSDTAQETRLALFTQIHQIIFYGKGGYDWHTIYNMPIWLRRFTFKQISDYYLEEKSSYENKKGNKTMIDSNGKVNTPEFAKMSHQIRQPAKYK
jgi:hypothetical protein